ncbi:hypothetical protein FEM48_Zijuj06G0138200 [Ziziphus jujuba var. spinosa]|nr:hypothetical protein FEM48_Zijuj06G0138200 [Ziziphus jujuba var. spinosa]
MVQDKPEWKVTIKNDCDCSQKLVTLECTGFETVEPVDPSIMSFSGSVCLLINGQPFLNSDPISFNYAWDADVTSFNPISSVINCP